MENQKVNNMFQRWIDKADDDLSFARAALRETEFYEHICFLAEQAVEKYFKAFIVKSKGRLRVEDKTYNLIYLSNVCKECGLDLADLEKELRWLSEIYIPSRYPMHLEIKFSKSDAQEAIKIA